jgi:hypothetical protein
MPDGGDIAGPRWLHDGRIVFSHRQPDLDGFLHHDLFLWTPSNGDVRRVTVLADVFDADPFPDGRSVVAVQSRFGRQRLVRVDLGSGAIATLTEFGAPVSHPRVSRDATRIAFVSHEGSGWSVRVRSLGDGRTDAVAGGLSPEWSSDGLVVVHAESDSIDLYRVPESGTMVRLTGVSGAAADPAPSPDGRFFFMSLEPDGFVLRVIDAGTNVVRASARAAPAEAGATFAEAVVAPSRRYGLGRQELDWFAGGHFTSHVRTSEIGLRLGDVVGRLDTLLVGSFGDRDGVRGGALSTSWKGWPVAVGATLFRADERELRHSGVELRASRELDFARSRLDLAAGALAGKRDLGFVDAAFTLRHVWSAARLTQRVDVSAESGDESHGRGALEEEFAFGGFRVGAKLQRDESSDATITIGGVRSSVIPDAEFAGRVIDPALPALSLRSDRYTGVRGEAGNGVVTAFWQQHRTTTTVRLAGIELTAASPALPLVKLPSLRLTTGVARILGNGPPGRGTRWWFSLHWRP